MTALALKGTDYRPAMNKEVRARRPHSATRMSNLQLSEVRVVLAESRTQVRSGLKGALAEAGLRNVTDVGRIETLADAIVKDAPDIVICDTDLAGEGSVGDLVRRIRRREVGSNPFLCIIAVAWNPTSARVDAIIESGVDALLAAPFSPQQIIDRIDGLVHRRKPFLVTSDYVGPDRRLESDTRKTSIPVMEPPNTLRLKAFGDWDLAVVRDSIENATNDIKYWQIERQASDVAKITEQVIEQSSMAGPDMSGSHLDRLTELLAALDSHARGLELPHLCDLCQSAAKLVGNMNKTSGARREKDLKLLQQTSLAISAATHPRERNRATLAHDIASTVNRAH